MLTVAANNFIWQVGEKALVKQPYRLKHLLKAVGNCAELETEVLILSGISRTSIPEMIFLHLIKYLN